MNTDRIREKSILVVEDDYLVADTLCLALDEEGACVVGPFPSVAKAMEAIDEGIAIDAALLDVNLNGERVYPLADRLVIEKVPIIMMTGYDEHVIPERYADLQKLQKPVRFEELMGSLDGLLNR